MKNLNSYTKTQLIEMIEQRDRALTGQKSSYENAARTQQKQIEKLRAQTTSDRVTELETRIEKLTADLAEAERDYADAAKTRDALRKELRDMQKAYDKREESTTATIDELREKLEEAEMKDNDVLSALVETCGILLPAGETPDESLDLYNLRRAYHDARVTLGVA